MKITTFSKVCVVFLMPGQAPPLTTTRIVNHGSQNFTFICVTHPAPKCLTSKFIQHAPALAVPSFVLQVHKLNPPQKNTPKNNQHNKIKGLVLEST